MTDPFTVLCPDGATVGLQTQLLLYEGWPIRKVPHRDLYEQTVKITWCLVSTIPLYARRARDGREIYQGAGPWPKTINWPHPVDTVQRDFKHAITHSQVPAFLLKPLTAWLGQPPEMTKP